MRRAEIAAARLSVARRRWSETGLRRNAVYLVRPDGYVALADPEGRAAALTSYLDARQLRCG